MRNISLFVEDRGHVLFLSALLTRLSNQHKLPIETDFLNAKGGHGKVVAELKNYMKDLLSDQNDIPDLLIVAIDGNCKGFQGRKQEIEGLVKGFTGHVVYAIPDPHIERWLLLDSAAFKQVLGKGCSAPTQKCERDLYKRLLRDAVRKTGVNPPLGGVEYAEAIVNAMNLEYLENIGDSLSKLLKELRQTFQAWLREDQKTGNI